MACVLLNTYTLALVDGRTIGRTANGCSMYEPYATLRTEMNRLENTYAFTDAGPGDATADATDAPAHD